MVDATNMSTPVTRGELREEIANMATKVDLANMAIKADLANMAIKADLANMATKADLANMATKADLANMATKARADLDIWGGALLAELARHTRASQEEMSTQISTFDDKYADLPARVTHLETAVFARKPR
jgi:hypothetical protein